MKKNILIIIALILCVNVNADPIMYLSGKCKITSKRKEKITAENDKIVFSAEFKKFEAFVKSYSLLADIKLTNLTDKDMKLSFHSAFFDSSKKLLVCTSRDFHLGAGCRDLREGPRILIPGNIITRIASYQIIIYDVEKDEKLEKK